MTMGFPNFEYDIVMETHDYGNPTMTGWWFQPLSKILVSWDSYSQ